MFQRSNRLERKHQLVVKKMLRQEGAWKIAWELEFCDNPCAGCKVPVGADTEINNDESNAGSG
jgi:hypothetical protein